MRVAFECRLAGLLNCPNPFSMLHQVAPCPYHALSKSVQINEIIQLNYGIAKQIKRHLECDTSSKSN
jgi:hypothetical protein